MTVSKLFTPIQVGAATLSHRVVMAPLTRFRAHDNHVHSELAIEYYSQRSRVPGTLLITEATFISPEAGGAPNVPGIWNEAQVAAWKPIVDAVHANGSYIFMQIWGLGRAAQLEVLQEEGPYPYVSASDIKRPDRDVSPRPLTTAEIKSYVDAFAKAAANAVHGAGFDGVEVHGANGYLVDQFIQDVSNKRADEYGGSIENRSRFALEIIDAISAKIGEERAAIRLSPWGRTGGMRMDDPIPQYSHLVAELASRHPNLAYVHVVEPRVSGHDDREILPGESNDFIRNIWRPRPVISAGGYTPKLAFEVAEKKGDLIAFGRSYISNPDLPARIANGVPLTKGNRSTYYAQGPQAVGYIDYPTAEELANTGKD